MCGGGGFMSFDSDTEKQCISWLPAAGPLSEMVGSISHEIKGSRLKNAEVTP